MNENLIQEYSQKDGTYLLSREGEQIGEIHEDENSEWDCGVESCRGTHYIANWPDGEANYVCGKGLKWITENIAQIM